MQKQTHKFREWIDGSVFYQRERGKWGGKRECVKRVNYMMMDGNYTFGGDHFLMYTDDKL